MAGKLDISTVLGLLVAVGGIVGGLLLEGGNVADIAQETGAIIVFGGTLGAVMVTTPTSVLLGALRRVKVVFVQPRYSPEAVIRQIMGFANKARRNGMVSLEDDANKVADPFLRKALSMGVDGTDVQEIRGIMELDLHFEEQRGRAEARVFEAAGGYAPTIGIIGAVLGLIQVMKHLQNMDEVGHGIAVAFVATVYGVGSANLLFLPAANKMKCRLEEALRMKELALEGVCAIAQGLHPKIIERRLEAYLSEKTVAVSAKPDAKRVRSLDAA